MSAKQKFGVVKTSNAGRALVAFEDFPPNQLILTDQSSVVAPITQADDSSQSIFCINCFKVIGTVRQIITQPNRLF